MCVSKRARTRRRYVKSDLLPSLISDIQLGLNRGEKRRVLAYLILRWNIQGAGCSGRANDVGPADMAHEIKEQ